MPALTSRVSRLRTAVAVTPRRLDISSTDKGPWRRIRSSSERSVDSDMHHPLIAETAGQPLPVHTILWGWCDSVYREGRLFSNFSQKKLRIIARSAERGGRQAAVPVRGRLLHGACASGVTALALGPSALGNGRRVSLLPPHVALAMAGLGLHGALNLREQTAGRAGSKTNIMRSRGGQFNPNRQRPGPFRLSGRARFDSERALAMR